MALPEDDLLALSNLSNARHKAEDATPRDGIESERPRAGHEISALDSAAFAEANSRPTSVTLCVVAAISCAVALAAV